jgi:xylose dehydrogenase (NAD/NADP)
MEAFHWRYHPMTTRTLEVIGSGDLGEIRHIATWMCIPLLKPSDIRWQPDLAGGSVMDVGCYCVSALRLLCGEPVGAAAYAVPGGAGVDVRFAATLRFADDVLGMFDCGFDVPPRGAIEVVGAGGTLVAEDPWHGVTPRLTLARPGEAPEQVPVEAAQPYRLELEDFSRAIRDGHDPRLGRDDALGQARAIEMLYAAAS